MKNYAIVFTLCILFFSAFSALPVFGNETLPHETVCLQIPDIEHWPLSEIWPSDTREEANVHEMRYRDPTRPGYGGTLYLYKGISVMKVWGYPEVDEDNIETLKLKLYSPESTALIPPELQTALYAPSLSVSDMNGAVPTYCGGWFLGKKRVRGHTLYKYVADKNTVSFTITITTESGVKVVRIFDLDHEQ